MNDRPAGPAAAVTHRDPYPYYKTLVREPGLVYDAGAGAWIAARAHDVEAVLTHDALHVQPREGLFARFARFNEGERHAELRASIERRCADIEIDAIARATARAAVLLEAELAGNGGLDAFVERIAPYALGLAIGVHEASLPATFDALVAFVSSGSVLGPLERMNADDVALLFQSYDATRATIACTLRALARAGGSVEDALAATLRDDPPVHNTRRYAAADAAVAGAELHAGDAVLVLLAAANRDPGAGERLYTFGFGKHRCPGRRIAETIAAAAIRHLLDRGLDPASLPDRDAFKPAPNVRIPLYD